MIRVRILETGQEIELVNQVAILRLNEGSAVLAPAKDTRHFGVKISAAVEIAAKWVRKLA